MAPNLVTLTGTLGVFVPLFVIIAYDTTLSEALPMWSYLLGATLIFLYQTFDAVDGKQARRTQTSGPLGQLFDHGCDAIVTTVATSIFFQAVLMGREPDLQAMFLYYFGCHLTFYFSQWEE